MYETNKLFVNKMPVFSPKIRPALILNNTIIFETINKYYALLSKYNNELHELDDESTDYYGMTDITKIMMLGQIQKCANNTILHNFILKNNSWLG